MPAASRYLMKPVLVLGFLCFFIYEIRDASEPWITRTMEPKALDRILDSSAVQTPEVITEKNILAAVHTYDKNIHFVSEAKGHWLKNLQTYAFTDEYNETATQAGVNVVKFKDEYPSTVQNFLSDGRAIMAFGYLRELLVQDESILWVLFGDDDTYFHISRILPRLPKYNPNDNWVLCPLINQEWCYGGYGMIISRGAFLSISSIQMWEAPGRYSIGGGDVRVSRMLQEMGHSKLTEIKDWDATTHRIMGDSALKLCQEEGRCVG